MPLEYHCGDSDSSSRRIWAVAFAGIAACGATAQVTPRYVSSREVILSIGAETRSEDRIELWQQRALASGWERVRFERRSANSILFSTELDGRYGLYFVLENDAGVSGPPPAEVTPPHYSIVVDTAPPTLQVRQARAVEDAAQREIELRLTVIEENLGPSGISIYYRPDDHQPWKDGGTLGFSQNGEKPPNVRTAWRVPSDLNGSIDLMILATDLAGNSSREEIRGVNISSGRPPASQFANDAQSSASKSNASGPHNAGSTPFETRKPELPPIDPPLVPAIERQRVNRLRSLASRYALDDQFDLAGARFEEAIRTTPDDATLFGEFGTMLVRAGRYEDARSRFEEALRLAPRNITAREGLALIAAGQQRYAEARDELRKLLVDEPQVSRLFLRLGDLEYRLGNKAEAFDAWEKVLSGGDADQALAKTARERLRQLRR